MNKVMCEYCGRTIKATNEKCPFCGNKNNFYVKPTEQEENEKILIKMIATIFVIAIILFSFVFGIGKIIEHVAENKSKEIKTNSPNIIEDVLDINSEEYRTTYEKLYKQYYDEFFNDEAKYKYDFFFNDVFMYEPVKEENKIEIVLKPYIASEIETILEKEYFDEFNYDSRKEILSRIPGKVNYEFFDKFFYEFYEKFYNKCFDEFYEDYDEMIAKKYFDEYYYSKPDFSDFSVEWAIANHFKYEYIDEKISENFFNEFYDRILEEILSDSEKSIIENSEETTVQEFEEITVQEFEEIKINTLDEYNNSEMNKEIYDALNQAINENLLEIMSAQTGYYIINNELFYFYNGNKNYEKYTGWYSSKIKDYDWTNISSIIYNEQYDLPKELGFNPELYYVGETLYDVATEIQNTDILLDYIEFKESPYYLEYIQKYIEVNNNG